MDYSPFDDRHYETLPVREGYREWSHTYEDTVADEMDLRLLERLQAVEWNQVCEALDLACGTGRIGVWLKRQGVAQIDGIDLTSEMLERARAKGVYRELRLGDILATGLLSAHYDLTTQVLADEHLESLVPLYVEAARLTRPGGQFVIVGYHPHFLMNGIPTHFDRRSGESVAIRSYVHLLSDHTKAAFAAGWRLLEMDEGIIDDPWITRKPKWEKYRNHPVSFCMLWQRNPD